MKDIVFRALNNAMKNGYHDLLKASPEDIAHDLRDCDVECENLPLPEIINHVVAWQIATFPYLLRS